MNSNSNSVLKKYNSKLVFDNRYYWKFPQLSDTINHLVMTMITFFFSSFLFLNKHVCLSCVTKKLKVIQIKAR